MKFKFYKGKDGKHSYLVHPCGRVEVQYQEGGKWVRHNSITAAKITHWRRSGLIERVYAPGHQNDRQRIEQRIAEIQGALYDLPDDLVPVHPNGLIVYERKAMQSVKADVLTCRGYDCWSAESGLTTINKGLSLMATMKFRRAVAQAELNALLAKLERIP